MNGRVPRILLAAVAAGSVCFVAGCNGSSSAATAAPTKLVGTFRLTAGACPTTTGTPTGSYLTVISASADEAVRNKAGGCANPDYTPLTPGKEGGLITGKFQKAPAPTFDAHRNAVADDIIEPVAFGHYKLGLATSALDEQDAPTGAPAFPAPAAQVKGTTISIDLRSLVVLYGGASSSTCAQDEGMGCWNLGSINASGTYDPATRRFTVEWLDGETFVPSGDSTDFHLTGTFTPA